MRMFRPDAVEIGFLNVGRNLFWQSNPCSGNAVIRGRQAGRICAGIVPLPRLNIYDLNLNRAFRTRIHAGGLAIFAEAPVTHVAFTNYPALGIVLRNSVGAVPGAVLATAACVSAMA